MSVLRKLSQFDFHHVLQETPGVSLVLFGAPGCGACRHLRQVLPVLREHDPALHLFYVDAGEDLALTREFGVFHLPALFVFRDGHYHAPLQAPPVPEALLRALRQTLRQPAREAP